MKITIKSTFNLNEMEIETQSVTLGALLDELSKSDIFGDTRFFDPERSEVYPDCDVHLNGQPYGMLADGLDTRLEDGDKVEIIIFTLAGG